jgi:AcrR family transcriptional regulator
MKRIINVKRARRTSRPYESPLRDEQTDVTRKRILDALVRTIGRGVAGLSIPAVAREAGVSVPTVYRHFRTKADLVSALGPYLMKKTRLMEVPEGDLASIARQMYSRNEAMDAEDRAALASQLGQDARRRMMPQRLGIIRKTIAERVPGLAGEDLDRLTRVAMILMSSATMRAYKDYLGLPAMEAAEDVAWTLEIVQRAVERAR